ncbi:hypothetical protein BDV28DRAFT_136192 [Aspergillus coremiiformis]|uniref:DNA-directed RNA polymerase subunit n=1 Tax=Aspergillus coremiiformis TaxID=138285 RepID=A0A5N6Z2J3_9EURO|nr:hypothetical protein BDV28DRAFT_136192 [Aspergillus coremiiformis]
MAVDAMDLDSNPVSATVTSPEKERKRKHKNKDASSSSPSKKKRKHESSKFTNETAAHSSEKKKKSKKSKEKGKSTHSSTGETAIPDSPYVLNTATLYLPISPISISPTHAKASLLAEHLSPLLLTYYPPLQGIVLAYSDASISSTPPSASTSSSPEDPNPKPLTLAKTAGEYGVLYVYLTATFLVFRPQRGQILEGWVNVQSEGFLGAVALNLFSVGIERKRLPSNWKWVPPGDEGSVNGDKLKNAASATASDDDESEPSASFNPEKEHFNPVSLANPISDTLNEEANAEDDESATEGYFQSVSGHRVRGTVRFRVVDVDVIPGSERDRSFLSIEGTMLSPEEEARVLEDERNGILTTSATPHRGSSQEPRASMSGALAAPSPAPVAELETPSKIKEPKVAKEKKSKSSKSKKKEKEK